MTKKKGGPSRNVKAEILDIDYWSKLGTNPSIKLSNGELISEKEYLIQFMRESYGGLSRKRRKILQTEEQHKWATRNMNALNRDALNVARAKDQLVDTIKSGHADYLTGETPESWVQAYKTRGAKVAVLVMIKEWCQENNIKYSFSRAIALIQFYYSFKKLLKFIGKSDIINKNVGEK